MKIFTNSYPRSGATGFNNALFRATDNLINKNKDELVQNDSWILKNHNPLLFLGTYDSEITACAIVRNPLDAISSNVFRWSKGFTGNMVHGRLIIDNNQIYNNKQIDSEMIILIEHQIDQYISYLYSILNSRQKIILFSYEQIKKETSWCIKSLLSFTEVNYNNIDEEAALLAIKNHDTSDEKTSMYFNIRKEILLSKKYWIAYKYYTDVMSLLQLEQKYYL